MIYIIGILICVLILIGCIVLLIYFIKDEKNLSEVKESELIRLGKTYSKKDFEDKMFDQYGSVLNDIQYNNYLFLKDAVADDYYNQILLSIKINQDKKQVEIIDNIKKDFCKLISLTSIDDLEVAKFWIKYSAITYTKGIVEDNNMLVEKVIKGDKDKPTSNEYIITFVKDVTVSEDIVCPNCGYQTHLLTSSKCIRCDINIVPKRKHWVLKDRVKVNISKK